MSRKLSLRNLYLGLPRAIGLVTFMLLAIAAVNYLAEATVQGASLPVRSSFAVPPGLTDDEWTGGPRECDLANGISAACIFMD